MESSFEIDLVPVEDASPLLLQRIFSLVVICSPALNYTYLFSQYTTNEEPREMRGLIHCT